MRIRILTVALLFATVPVIAAAQGVYISRPKLPPCPQPANYLQAVELKKQAAAEAGASHLREANDLMDQALARLGTNYDPYHRTIDDSAQYLNVAAYLVRGGKLAAAIREKQMVLDERLGMQMEPMLCNKVVTQVHK